VSPRRSLPCDQARGPRCAGQTGVLDPTVRLARREARRARPSRPPGAGRGRPAASSAPSSAARRLATAPSPRCSSTRACAWPSGPHSTSATWPPRLAGDGCGWPSARARPAGRSPPQQRLPARPRPLDGRQGETGGGAGREEGGARFPGRCAWPGGEGGWAPAPLTLSCGGWRPTSPATAASTRRVVARLVERVGVAPSALGRYSGETGDRLRREHAALVVERAGWTTCGPGEWKALGDWLVARAIEHDTTSVLFRQRPLNTSRRSASFGQASTAS